MVVVALAAAWGRDRYTLQAVKGWWSDHLEQEHSSNPNDYKRLIEREGPPF